MELQARLRQMAKFHRAQTECPSAHHYTWCDESDEAAERIDVLESEQRETLRAVLHHFGPDGAKLVTDHVLQTLKKQ